jgi:biopolymer transport protein ExbD
MAKFVKKGAKGVPAISTASLPDIIFILLFFFMVVTVMRETEIMVKNVLPKATELTKLENKELVSYIYVGKPTENFEAKYGDAPRVQLNDKFSNVKEIGAFVFAERAKLPLQEMRDKMIFALRIDEEVKMGIVTDVKFELRKVNALKINYSARPDEGAVVQGE